MKRFLLLVIALLSMTAFCAGCSERGGTPPVLTIGDTEITLGESSPGHLLSQDFEVAFAGNYMPIGNMPANSWLSDLLVAKKDQKNYAYLYIYNPEKKETPYLNATLYKVSFKIHSKEEDYWAENNTLVNGIDFSGMDSPAVKEAMADYKLANETDSGSLRFEDGSYKYFISFSEETGVVEEVGVEMAIAKSYSSAN